MKRILALVLVPLSIACGISEEEHKAAIQKDRDEQKALFDKKMREMQAAHTKEIEDRDKQLNTKSALVSGLETKVTELGGNLEKVRSEMGAELASAASQLASTTSKLAATNAEVEQLRKLREKAERELQQQKKLTERFKAMIDAGQLSVVKRKGRLMLKLPDNILFPSGSRRLKKDGRKALEEVASVLKDVQDRDFIVAGHTDNIPVRRGGRFKNNWELSTARAVTVAQLMIKNGVAPTQLSAAGFGEFDPIEPNETKDGRKKNRRLEIILMPKIEDI